MTLDVSQSSQADSARQSPQHPRAAKMKHCSLGLHQKLSPNPEGWTSEIKIDQQS